MRMRTWYGMDALVESEPGWLHRAGLGRLVLPHPPLVNWLLRWGLPTEAYRSLSLAHEFGHLQTLPLALVYALSLFAMATVPGSIRLTGILLLLLSAHAAWEIMSEIYTMTNAGTLYADCYRGIPVLPRVLFWAATTGLTAAGWLLVPC